MHPYIDVVGDDSGGVVTEGHLEALLAAAGDGHRASLGRLFDALAADLQALVTRHLDDAAALDLWLAIWREAPRLARIEGPVRTRITRFAAEHLARSAVDDPLLRTAG